MFVVLMSVCFFGVSHGIIQASMDPENHKCCFAIIFGIAQEMKRTEPIGMAIGLVFAFLIEYLRQQEIEKRPKGRNSLERTLD